MEQREEELQQQMRSLRTKEATLSRNNSELSHRSQQMETRLEVLESELNSAKEQVWIILLFRCLIDILDLSRLRAITVVLQSEN